MKNKVFVPTISLLAFTLCFVNLYSINTMYQDLSPARLGMYTTFYYLGYLVSQLPGGLFADKYGPKRLLIICIVLSGISTIALAFIDDPVLAYVMRIIGGLGSGPIMACASKLISNTFEDLRKRTGALGFLLCSPPLGLLMANSLTPFLLSMASRQVVLLLLGLLNLPVAILAIGFLKPTPKVQVKISILESVVVYRKSKTQVMLALVGFVFMFVVVGFGIWARKYYQYLGYSTTEINQLMTVFSVCAVLGAVVSGYLPVEHTKYLKVVFSVIGICFAVFAVLRSNLFVFSVLFGLIAYLPSAHFTAMAIELSPEKYRASAASLQNFFMQIGAFIMPTVTSVLLQCFGMYRMLWGFFAVLAFLASAMLWLLQKKPSQVYGNRAN
ncbi:MFS transporter [Sphaerochaeta sp.]|uniref:MFS transporter n=1 Tax=Sphaerochaeta sp. TaxID=1972642 RepID=UPI002FCA4948